jgi:PAS domain S-box-containing protein
MALFALTLLVLLVGGGWFYRAQETRLRAEAEENLQAISRLKIDQITQWRDERLTDAEEMLERSFTREVIARWISALDPGGAEQILSWFRSLQKHYRFSDVLLVDAGGHTLLSLSGRTGPLHAETMHAVESGFRERRSVICDLHIAQDNHSPRVEVIAPLFSEGGDPLGAIIERMDAREFLYPLVASWPTESRSAETLLVRRDGDSVLFLNDSRHRKNTALNLRVPLTDREAPTVMAVLGRTGTADATDYRGVKVLATLQPVPGSQWFMVTKVDKTEVLAEWQSLSTIIVALLLGLVIAMAATMGMAWQHYAKAQLRESEERYRDLYDEAPVGYIEMDSEGRIDRVNRRMLELLGYGAEEMLGQPLWKFVVEREDAEKTIRAKVAGLEPPNEALERNYKRKNGPPVPVLIKDRVARDIGGKITRIRATIQDISERKRAEEALRRSRDELEIRVRERTAELERRNRELQDFVFIASHDLQEPLRKIQVLGDLLSQRSGETLDVYARDRLERIVKASQRMRCLIQSLLAYSRIGREERAMEETDLTGTVKQALSLLEVSIQEKNARVEVEPLPRVRVDPVQMVQLFQNLLSNGLKFHREGEPPHIRIYARAVPGAWELCVEDNGIGFEEKYLEKIFVPFQKLHHGNRYAGVGMGLAICRKVVERHGGSISARSTPGKGSAFIVTLPQSSSLTPIAPSPETFTISSNSQQRSFNISP